MAKQTKNANNEENHNSYNYDHLIEVDPKYKFYLSPTTHTWVSTVSKPWRENPNVTERFYYNLNEVH